MASSAPSAGRRPADARRPSATYEIGFLTANDRPTTAPGVTASSRPVIRMRAIEMCADTASNRARAVRASIDAGTTRWVSSGLASASSPASSAIPAGSPIETGGVSITVRLSPCMRVIARATASGLSAIRRPMSRCSVSWPRR